MFRKSFLLGLLLVMMGICGSAAGQSWSGILSTNRAIDWTQAGATIINRTTVCTTLNPGATAAQINTALNSCSNGVVQLAAGTFNLSASIVASHSNVTLRGAGANQTFLVFSGASTNLSNCSGLGYSPICIWNGDGNYAGYPDNKANWTAGYSKGATSITLASYANLQVGSLLMLDQTDPSSLPSAGISLCGSNTSAACSYEGTGTGTVRAGRSQFQAVTVTGCGTTTQGAACTSGNVTISPGLYLPNWSSAQSPQAWWGTVLPISGVGIENLSLDTTGITGTFGGQTIMLQSAAQSWVKGIRSINSSTYPQAASQHIMGWTTSHITVRDSYFYGSNPQANGYGISPSSYSADWLIENNICQHVASCIVTQGADGIVIGYNYAVDNYFGGTWQQGDVVHHSAGDNFLLIEGHEGSEVLIDDIHGSSAMGTVFRSYLSGYDTGAENGAKNQATFGIAVMAYSRYYNLVGNVSGKAGYHLHYQDIPLAAEDCTGSNGDPSHSVYLFGWTDQGGTEYSAACGFAGDLPNDPLSASTSMRWGNSIACTGDPACGAARWQTSELASSDPTYPGLSNPSTTLPSSFYLSAKPSWWGSSIPWPQVGPDVTGGNIANAAGHAFHNPAANCYLNVMGGATNGSSGALTFNPASCYTAGTPPPTPFSLIATPTS